MVKTLSAGFTEILFVKYSTYICVTMITETVMWVKPAILLIYHNTGRYVYPILVLHILLALIKIYLK